MEDFLDVAGEVFGLDPGEAFDLYLELSDTLEREPDVEDLEAVGAVLDWMEDHGMLEVVEEPDIEERYPEAFEEDVEEEDIEPLEYDEYWEIDDEWLDPGEEVEVTVEVAYEEGK